MNLITDCLGALTLGFLYHYLLFEVLRSKGLRLDFLSKVSLLLIIGSIALRYTLLQHPFLQGKLPFLGNFIFSVLSHHNLANFIFFMGSLTLPDVDSS